MCRILFQVLVRVFNRHLYWDQISDLLLQYTRNYKIYHKYHYGYQLNNRQNSQLFQMYYFDLLLVCHKVQR